MKRRRRRPGPKAPAMTAGQAVSFDRFSIANAVTVASALACGCEAYQDVFTYRRWKAQGYQVAKGSKGSKGSKAIKLPQVCTVDRENQDGSIEQVKLFHTSAVFCRHQLKEG